MVLAAAESLAAIRARSKLGMAMAAMIKMIATTISSSIKEKPFCLRIRDLLWESFYIAYWHFGLESDAFLFAG